MRFWIGLLLAGLWLSGCISPAHRKAMDTERALMAAGFQMQLANSDAKLAQVGQLPQRRVTAQERDGTPLFVYADAKYCRCLYAGDERAYRRFERISLVKGFQDERRETAEALRDASFDWGPWRPWGPWR